MVERRKRYPRTNSEAEVRRAFALLSSDLDTVSSDFSAFVALVAATYVPYSGAISDVSLGAYDLTATDITVTNIANIDTISSTVSLSVTNSVDIVGDVSAGSISLTGYVDGYAGVTADGEILYWDTGNGRFSVGDHGSVGGLGDDDHTQYSLVDGTRAFTGAVAGVTPVADADLATKAYVDSAGGTVVLDNDEGVALVIGTPVYISADGAVSRAQASALAKANVFGLVKDSSIAVAGSGKVLFSGVLEATTGEWDAVTGGTGGLSPQSIYYLSQALGQLTEVPVSAVGEVCTEIGTAVSPTQLKVEIRRTIEL